MSEITDRIAAIARRHREELHEENVCICGYHGNWATHVAEVIVEQLGLAQEWAAADKSDKGNTYGVIDGSRGGSRENAARYVYFDRLCAVSRYVSKWEAG